VTSTDLVKGERVTAKYREVWKLVLQPDGWKLDAVQSRKL
jgi:hypothetical protein